MPANTCDSTTPAGVELLPVSINAYGCDNTVVTGVKSRLNCLAVMVVGVSVCTIGSACTRGGQAQHETSPQGESRSDLVHSCDLPGLIVKVRGDREPLGASHSVTRRAGERLRTGPAGHGLGRVAAARGASLVALDPAQISPRRRGPYHEPEERSTRVGSDQRERVGDGTGGLGPAVDMSIAIPSCGAREGRAGESAWGSGAGMSSPAVASPAPRSTVSRRTALSAGSRRVRAASPPRLKVGARSARPLYRRRAKARRRCRAPADRPEARPSAAPVVAVEHPARQADGQQHGDPVLNLANARLDLVRKGIPQPEHERRAERGRHQVGHQQLEVGSLRMPAVRYAAVRKPGTNRPETRILKPWRWK